MKRLSADRSNSYRMMGPSRVVPYNDFGTASSNYYRANCCITSDLKGIKEN